MKKKVINDKGITLISVVIIVIILLILAGVATVSGISTVRFARFTAFRTELQMLQNEVNGLKQEKTNEELASLGTEMTAEQKQIFDVSEVSSVLQGKGMDINTLENGFKYFSEEYLTDDLKIDGMTRDYYINLEQRIIISTEPVTYENVDYYMLEQMENGGYNVQYNNQVGDLSFELKAEQLSNSKGKITIFNITYPGYIEKWEAQYRIQGTENWNSAGEFTGDNYEFEVTQAGTYEVRLIHGGEVESGIQIAEISQNIVTASDLANATDKTNIYGATVTNYKTADETKAKADGWKIFYAGTVGDETTPHIYLIASDYIEYQYVPYSTKDGIATTNKPTQSDENSKGIIIDEILGDYAGSSDITDSRIKALNYSYFSQGFENTYNNMKTVAYMLDIDAWKYFAGTKAEYAVGGPTVELLMKSYNQKYGVDYKAQATNSTGYQISNNGGSSWTNSISGAINKSDTLYIIDGESLLMLLASPASSDPGYLMAVASSGIIGNYDCSDDGRALRPIVCLKADIQLQKNDDGTYTIIDNSEPSTDDYIQDGLVLHLDGINNTGEGDLKHNGSATVWKDLSGNNNDATLQNVNFGNAESGWSSNCLKLDGVDDYATIADSETMKPLGQTIEIVFNRTGEAPGNTDSSKRGIIFVRWFGYTVELNSIDENNNFSISYGRGYGEIGSSKGYLQSNSKAQLNKKYYIGATHENNISKMYLNSIYEGEQQIEPHVYSSMNETRIGQYIDQAYTKANIYAIRMYNRALSEEEIKYNYNIDKIRFGLD